MKNLSNLLQRQRITSLALNTQINTEQKHHIYHTKQRLTLNRDKQLTEINNKHG